MLFELRRDETSTSASGGADHDAVSDERLRVDLGEVDETLFRALLQFCYTDQVDVDVDKVEDLGKLATTCTCLRSPLPAQPDTSLFLS